MNALPNEAETLKAIQALDLLVVIDTMPSEIAGYADVVLPEIVFLERYDELLVGWGRRGWMSLRQPVVERTGRTEARLVDREGTGRPARHSRVHAVQGHRGVPRLPRRERRASASRNSKPKGVIMGGKKPITVEEGLELSVRHAVGQGRVLVRSAGEERLRPGAEVHEARRSARGLLPPDHGRAPVHTFSRTQSNPLLTGLMRENEIWVNAATAAQARAEDRRST